MSSTDGHSDNAQKEHSVKQQRLRGGLVSSTARLAQPASSQRMKSPRGGLVSSTNMASSMVPNLRSGRIRRRGIR